MIAGTGDDQDTSNPFSATNASQFTARPEQHSAQQSFLQEQDGQVPDNAPQQQRPATAKRAAHRRKALDWQKHKPELQEMYLRTKEKISLPEIMEHMKEKHGFDAT